MIPGILHLPSISFPFLPQSHGPVNLVVQICGERAHQIPHHKANQPQQQRTELQSNWYSNPKMASEMKGNKIMVLLDGSKMSEKVLNKALYYKREKDILHVVTCVKTEPSTVQYYDKVDHVDKPEIFTAHTEEMKKRAEAVVKHFIDMAKQRKASFVEGSVLVGFRPAEEAIKFAHEQGFNTIVVGQRGFGLSSVAEITILGSFSRQIVDRANCDVILVKT
eukprot:g55088.t1